MLLVLPFQAVAVPALVPINNVPVLTALITKASTVPSTSASLPCVCKLAKVIAIWLSSLPVATVEAKAVKVGASFTDVTLTVACTAVADSNPPLSLATAVKALRVPLAFATGVQ